MEQSFVTQVITNSVFLEKKALCVSLFSIVDITGEKSETWKVVVYGSSMSHRKMTPTIPRMCQVNCNTTNYLIYDTVDLSHKLLSF